MCACRLHHLRAASGSTQALGSWQCSNPTLPAHPPRDTTAMFANLDGTLAVLAAANLSNGGASRSHVAGSSGGAGSAAPTAAPTHPCPPSHPPPKLPHRDAVALLSMYLAAVVHDYDHRGVNNQFLVRLRVARSGRRGKRGASSGCMSASSGRMSASSGCMSAGVMVWATWAARQGGMQGGPCLWAAHGSASDT